jgi:putative NADH-flavin reductase
MKVTIIGATGMIGQKIVEEALKRGHHATVIVRDPSKLTRQHENLSVVVGDIQDAEQTAKIAAGSDALISAFGPSHDHTESLIEATKSLIAAVKLSGVNRLITVGGAGSLEVAPGLQLVDAPSFPEVHKKVALAHRDALELFKQSDVNWTNVCPPAFIEPGARTGQYQVGTDQLVSDATGKSYISTDDYAIALIDELENAKFVGKRFTVAN